MMNINRWWIRDLFRYSLAYISSLSIILYIVFSIFFDICLENNKSDYSSLSFVEYLWDNQQVWDKYDNKEQFYSKEYYGIKRELKNERSPNNKIFVYNTNQSLQNGNSIIDQKVLDERKENIEDAEWNYFNIDEIINNLNLQKEKRVAVVAKNLGIDRKKEKLDYAKLAWIEWNYNWSLEQNQKIRNYLIANAQEIYKDKHWWNERDSLPLVTKKEENKEIKLNSKEIAWQVTYNDVTLKVVAPVWSFPEGSILKIKTLEDNDSITTFDITLKEVLLMTQVDNIEFNAPIASFDISFYAPDDTEFLTELQPATWKYVSVVFDYTNNDNFRNTKNEWFVAVYHMEDNDDTSIASLVNSNFPEKNTKNSKSDSIGIYANALSVYILTIVSDLDEEISQYNKTITLDTGIWEIIPDDNIVLFSTWDNSNVYTWKILSKDNSIILPDIQMSWYNFWWWYSNDMFLWLTWNNFKLWDTGTHIQREVTENAYDADNYEIHACIYEKDFSWNVCLPYINKNVCFHSERICTSWDDTSMNIEAIHDSYIPSEEEIQKYGQDVFIAYNWAIHNWISTINDINEAKLNKKITRAELAKMMVVFMSWTLQREPIIEEEANYKDVDSKKLWDLAWYIELAYQYQIMGINADWTPIDEFNPNKTVSRWEFATVLSRVLFGNKYNQNWANYYEKHIEALEEAHILNNTNPNLVEARWWIMTMLYNTQNSN